MQHTITDEELALVEIGRRIAERDSKTGEDEIKRGPLSEKEISRIKLDVCREFGLKTVPSNSQILHFLDPSTRERFNQRLHRKTVRTRSGIAVVTAITKPFNCPHGTCTFCPGGVRFGTPQSYTKSSPAASFGEARGYDAHTQVQDALEILRKNGHDTSKIEMILLGGTILAMPFDYQLDFVKRSYEALNGNLSLSLEDAKKQNETASHRCVGLTIETKPDWCKEEHVDLLLSYGTTRVEIGVQSLRDEVLRLVNRGHTLEETLQAFRVSKDSCLKLVAHMMPGLPGSDLDRDLEDLRNLVNDKRYKPDMLKIYPTLVVEGTALFNQYKMGKYKPYSLADLIHVLSEFKKDAPPWLRIMRIQREIPKTEISGGANQGNLRQIVLEDMERRGLRCKCIRCREVGRRRATASTQAVGFQGEDEARARENFDKLPITRLDYEASEGHEVFLSLEEVKTDTLYGFLRMRIPSGREHRPEIREQSTSLVRELHVYGQVVPLGRNFKEGLHSGRPQHHGFGTRLLLESERIAKEEFRRKKHIVIAAVGTKEYYRNRGYRDDGPFVSKVL
ncbi:MAG TPA: tRNA uridine(34) 5-carboxymethylaminomethyl modification radical SAM/GNAT enzyme Elp3 [Nitrososphaerales archaeon]|nr:tRNA uridine(34) 5-carboxymethylaminomethyl modification radical SAM/GNAT enzyme Elp3 [Nitrososphaerales archaeon]